MSTVLKNFLPYLQRFVLVITLSLLLLATLARDAQPQTEAETTYVQSGIAQLQQGNYQQALEDFNYSIEQKTDLAVAYSNRCLTQIYLEDYLHAWQDCTRSLQQQSDNYLAYFHRGLAFYRLGDYQQAIADYHQTLKLKPTYYQAYYNRGLVYSALKQHLLALKDFNQSLGQITGDNSDSLAAIYRDRGLSHLALNNFISAQADFYRSLRFQKNNPSAYYNLACTAHQLGQDRQAIDYLNQAIALDPFSAHAYIQRGLIHHQLGYYQSALADLNQGANHLYQQGLQDNYQRILALIEQIQQQLMTLPSPLV
jgi:tetratricopeptide (TPR) repeat protein